MTPDGHEATYLWYLEKASAALEKAMELEDVGFENVASVEVRVHLKDQRKVSVRASKVFPLKPIQAYILEYSDGEWTDKGLV